MNDERAYAVARIESGKVAAAHAAVASKQDRSPQETSPRQQRAAAAPSPATETLPGPTDLSFRVDAEAGRLWVQVIDRETRAVLRSFPLVLPGADAAPASATPRGALVDAKA